jgi:nucleotide-binding universal stress UspA family protein
MLEKIRRILVAYDGSENSDMALEAALDLAEKHSPIITILNILSIEKVLDSWNPFPNLLKRKVDNKLKEEEIKRNEILSTALEKAKKTHPTLKVSTSLMKGDPVERIVEIAEEEDYDLVVMGSRGLSGLKEVVLGSVCDKVADRISASILILK